MVKFVLMFLMTLSVAHADLFDFGKDSGSRESRVLRLIEKLKSLQLKDEPGFEETFNQTIKALENGIEEEKLYCSGEVADSAGKMLPAAQKQLCMRELKKQYMEAINTIFEMKKKYLGIIHSRQIKKLSEIQQKTREDIEKNF